MSGFARLYSRLSARLSLLCLVLAGAGLVAMTAIVAWIVFSRYVLNSTATWGEPVALNLMLWFILLGGAVGVRELDHMGFDIGLHYLRGRARGTLVFVNEALVTFFGLAMVYYGTLLAAKVWNDSIAMLGISKGWDYVPIVVGGALIALFSLEKLIVTLAGETVAPMPFALGGHDDGHAAPGS